MYMVLIWWVRRYIHVARPSPGRPLTLLLEQRVLLLQVVDVLLVRVVFPPHELDVLCGFV